MSTAIESISDELKERSTRYRWWSRINYGAGYVSTLIAVLASFFASLTAVTNEVPSKWVAFFAAMPGLALLLNNSFRYQERAFWHSKKAYQLEILAREIQFKSLPIGDASDKLGAIDLEMSDEWERISMMRIPGNKGAA